MKYADLMMDWLVELGYSHCFFVPGGNSMHLLDGARTRMKCIPFVHEMSATIAAEYFNETADKEKSFVLLTAGPGLTHAVSGIAGTYLEGRPLLVIGGQVKTSDLATGNLRQRGIQEIDGVSIVESITKRAVRLDSPMDFDLFLSVIKQQYEGKPGPVFLEIPLDIQGMDVPNYRGHVSHTDLCVSPPDISEEDLNYVCSSLRTAKQPILLIGGGVRREIGLLDDLVSSLGLPVMTTYNGADRIGSDHDMYFGRPNTWGMRYSNILIAQADLVLAIGTRLGLQQTGFNYKGFAPKAKIIQVDVDAAELDKGHPIIDKGILGDAVAFLEKLSSYFQWTDSSNWIDFCLSVKKELPLSENCNSSHDGYWNPYDFLIELSEIANTDDVVVPCSSGGSFTAFYQAFLIKSGQKVVSDKSLASMGYGLAGAIGASIANPNKRILHVEGDGGFSQNLQELATVAVHKTRLKTFLWCNEGYASIRMTQKNYFGGQYLGCDISSGLGFPDWLTLGKAYGIQVVELKPGSWDDKYIAGLLNSADPVIFLVMIHPEQTFLPKISSRITETGSMESEPLWDISPKLESEQKRRVLGRAPFDIAGI